MLIWNVNNHIYLTSAPTKVEIVQVSTTTVTAKATAPAGNTGIEYFEASVVNGASSQKCTVNKSDEPPQCEIKGLTLNTEYTISMRACLPGSYGCSPGVTTNTRTLPHRTLVSCMKDDRTTFFLWLLIFSRLAPLSITIESISPNKLKVTVTPNALSTGVTLYKVSSGEKACEIAVPSNPLTCSLTELSAATEYTVDAKACSSTSHCSEAITKEAWTPPNGQLEILWSRWLKCRRLIFSIHYIQLWWVQLRQVNRQRPSKFPSQHRPPGLQFRLIKRGSRTDFKIAASW